MSRGRSVGPAGQLHGCVERPPGRLSLGLVVVAVAEPEGLETRSSPLRRARPRQGPGGTGPRGIAICVAECERAPGSVHQRNCHASDLPQRFLSQAAESGSPPCPPGRFPGHAVDQGFGDSKARRAQHERSYHGDLYRTARQSLQRTGRVRSGKGSAEQVQS